MVSTLLHEKEFVTLAVALRDRWGFDPSHSDLDCIRRLAFENDPPVAGGPKDQPWGDETWLLYRHPDASAEF